MMNVCQSLLDNPLSRTTLQKKHNRLLDIRLLYFIAIYCQVFFILLSRQMENVSKLIKFSIS